MWMVYVGAIFFTLCATIYNLVKWATKNQNYFRKKNVKSLKPWPIIGNTGMMLFRRLSPPEFIQNLYNKHPEEGILGFYEQRKPYFIITDPELVKYLAVKEFDHFLDHRAQVDIDMDPLFGKSLIGLRGYQWKQMRSTLSPAFTGSKMRSMFELVSKCGNQMAKYFKKNTNSTVIDIKDFFSRIANDIIATCAFGFEINSLEQRDNFFYMMGDRMTNFGNFKAICKSIGYSFFPSLMKKCNISFVDQNDTNYFRSIIFQSMKIREEENIVRPDMINLLMKLQKGQSINTSDQLNESFELSDGEDPLNTSTKCDWDDNELAAQCFIFFFAGFETVSTTMSFIGYELALNPDIQEKLCQEIDMINDELDGDLLNYEVLKKMTYLDKVISEGLRKWPPVQISDRMCTSDLVFEYKGRDIEFNVGDDFWIPIFAFHRDPKYFPDPEKFDPERFSNERKHEINQAAYIPFGVGPRNCIGTRFALMEIKAIFYYILKDFIFEVCERTDMEFKYGRRYFRMLPDKGIWLRLKSRY